MIVTLISLFILLVGVVYAIREIKTSKDRRLNGTSFILLLISGAFGFLSIIMILINTSYTEFGYETIMQRREILEYRMEHVTENFANPETLLHDIENFNRLLREKKRSASNPWINWFNNQKMLDVDYIDIHDLNVDSMEDDK